MKKLSILAIAFAAIALVAETSLTEMLPKKTLS